MLKNNSQDRQKPPLYKSQAGLITSSSEEHRFDYATGTTSEITEFKIDSSEYALVNKEQSASFERDRKDWIKRERDLLNEIKDLNVSLATLEGENQHYKQERRRILVLNLLSIIFIGVGSSIIGTSLQSILGIGGLFILIGAILYIVAYLPS
jgi:hypothetical protein